MKWDRLKLFNIVAQTGNLTRASEILNQSQSSLSRQMKSSIIEAAANAVISALS